MMAFPSMIVKAAEDAGMKVPLDIDKDYDKEDYPHWHVYCALQLGVPVTWGNHWENAKIIAKIPTEDLKKMSVADFKNLGFDP